MGQYYDFVVPYTEDKAKLGEDILKHLIIYRLKQKKPVVVLLVGDSGEGKSYTGLKILDIVNRYYNVDTAAHIDDQVIYTPLEYTQKMDKLLYDKEARDLKAVMIDEAREMLPAKMWYSFVSRAISDVNALHRTIKPLVLIVVVQFVKDIQAETRRTVQYYFRCVRPVSGNVIFYPSKIWKDDKDIEKPKLRKRSIRGYVVKDNNQYVSFRPKRYRVRKPDKRITKPYDKLNFERKSKIIRNKLEKMLKKIQAEIGQEFDQIDKLVEYYAENPQLMKDVIYRRGNRYHVKKKFQEMHDLTQTEKKEFEKRYTEKLVTQGLGTHD